MNLGFSLFTGVPRRIPSHCMKATLSLLLILNLGSVLAWAGLGQSEASVSADQQYMKSEDHVQSFQAYKVHQLTSANGPTVREYVSPQGVVFGITWQGRFVPDMNQLLGTYVTNLQTATPAQTQIRHLRGLTVKTDVFVYSNFCHMQICKGSAYVASLVPSNISVEVVR
jgi:hypothetical protein